MPASITSEQIWGEVGKRSFAVLGFVMPPGEARTAGIVYAVRNREIHIVTGRNFWKARHIDLPIRIRPTGMFVTYGIGVPLRVMRNPLAASGRALVGCKQCAGAALPAGRSRFFIEPRRRNPLSPAT